MRTLHISHNDLDGVGCGILIKKFLSGSIDTIYLGYDDIDNYIEENMYKYDRIIISDVSPSFSSVEMLAGEKDVVILDHHASTEPLKEFHFTVHDLTKCATLITWHWLKEQGYDVSAYEEFALCVNDVDLWQLKRNDSLKMGMLFHLLGIDRFEKRFYTSAYTSFTDTEKLLIELEEERKSLYIKKAMRNIFTFTDINGYTATVVFAEAYASELGNSIISDGIADYIILINPQQKKISLRSRSEVDIRCIAEENGGGGHKNAAGFSIKNENFNLDNILKNMGVAR